MLGLQVFANAGGEMLADFSSRLHSGRGGGMRFSTDAHGFGALDCQLIPMTLDEAFACYDWPGTPHVVVTDDLIGTVWEGRLEDISIVDGGLALTAFGYQRAMHDVPYTGLWSKSGSGDWRVMPNSVYTASRGELFETDNNNRLYFVLREGETYASGRRVAFGYSAPDGGQRKITNISFDYNITLPTNWTINIFQTDNWSSGTDTTALTGNNVVQSGSYSLALATPRTHVAVCLVNNTGGNYIMSGTYTGDWYARCTNLRVKTTTASTVVASAIFASIGAYVDAINTSQLYADSVLITPTTTDLRDELYEDMYPADIFDRLALLHGYEWGIFESRRPYFRPKGSAGREWYVDVTQIIRLQRSLENVRNSAYGLYRDADGAMMRTDVADDTASQTRYGVVRRGVVDVDTTSETEAETHRDVFLSDRADNSSRAEIRFSKIYNASGGEMPLYAMRAGDTVTMRNLPPSLGATVDRIRTFVISETEYDAMNDEISIAPEAAVPSLDRLVARRDAGIR